MEQTPWDFEEVTDQELLNEKLESRFGPCDAGHKYRIGQGVLVAEKYATVLWVIPPQEAGVRDGVWYPDVQRRYVVRYSGETCVTILLRDEMGRFITGQYLVETVGGVVVSVRHKVWCSGRRRFKGYPQRKQQV